MMLLSLLLFVELIIAEPNHQSATYRLPAEWEPHQRTLMAWPRSATIWETNLWKIQDDISRLANTIVQFEPVALFAGPEQVLIAQKHVDPKVEVVAMEIDDFWTRDISPIFVYKTENGKESIAGVDYNFNGWGNKQVHGNDSQFAKNVLERYNTERIVASIISEGGACQTDGKGTLLAPKSSLVNTNRNNQTIEEIEIELKRLFGIRKIIWFDSVAAGDITDGHIDCLVRYIRPGVVLLDRPFPGAAVDIWAQSSDQAYSVLMNSTDADGNPFEIIEVFEPDRTNITDETPGTYVTSYLNFLIGNGFVAVPAFGDVASDLKAQKVIQAQFPDRKVVLVQINNIAAAGGGIHCATYQHPALSKAGHKVASLSLVAIVSLISVAISLFTTRNVFIFVSL